MNTLVVLPTYNEALNLEPLAYALLNHARGVHVLVVDDNSPDGTGNIADRLAANITTRGRLHVLHREAKEGLGRAYLAGFAWALAHGCENIITMDADFSHDPIYLSGLLDAADGADMVIGSRYLNGVSVVNWPLRRILLSWGANQYVRAVAGLAANDCTSGYRLYRRRVLEAVDLSGILSNGYSFLVEMAFRVQAAGFVTAEVPIIFTERKAGQSKVSRRVLWESILMPLKLRACAGALRRRLAPAVLAPVPLTLISRDDAAAQLKRAA